MAEVFISYHEKSAGGLAAQIADTLEASGISCWYAKRDIPTGGDFARAIPLQIDACKVFLLILNEDAQTSEHIGNELALAFSRWNRKKDITIFPVKIGDFEEESWIKYYLVRAQILKCAVLDAERMQELARRVAQQLNRGLKPPAKIIKHGECGKDVRYTLDENGVLKIFGKGPMRDFKLDDGIPGIPRTYNTRWWNERKMISHTEIQCGVTTIGTGAFDSCTELISVHIPDSVTSIGRSAFYDCRNLMSVHIPDSVTSIGRSAFYHCQSLTIVTIPDSVTSIGRSAFSGCWRLKSVTIPDSVTSIGVWAFRYCTSLASVSVPARAEIKYNTFPDSVTVMRRT